MASKRPYDRSPKEPNGRRKMQRMGPSDGNASPGLIVFRVLCPGSKFGSLVGKGGSIVGKIRQETGAKIKIEDSMPGCDERVVIISGFDKEKQIGNPQSKDAGNEKNNNDNVDEGNNSTEREENNEKEAALEPLSSGKAMTSLQKALLLVFERIAESDFEGDGGEGSTKDSSAVTVRMLVLPSQVGCLLGRGGNVIRQMSAESGAQIRILPKDKRPLCASSVDEVVQITGQLDEVKKALQSVSQQLLDNPPREIDFLSINKPSGPSSYPFPRPDTRADALPPLGYRHPLQGPPFPPRFHEPIDHLGPPIPNFPEGAGRLPISPEPVTFRLVCVNDKIGSVIGKGGTIIKKLQIDTGCEVKVVDAPANSEDRVIVITGPALPDDRISPPQDAALRLLDKIVTPVPEKKDNSVLTRVLVSSNQIGCLLGRGGAIITEMRKATGAQIRVLSKDQLPKCATENDEVVQISGEYELVQDALVHVTSRLKHHYFRDRLPALNPLGRPGFVDQGPPFPPFMGRRESSPPGPYPKFGPSFGGPPFHDDRAFLPPGRGEQLPPSGPWLAPGNDVGGPMHDYMGAPQRRMGGFPGGSQPAVITNTTVDVVVPRSVVPSIYGEDGGSLKQIRQISGANITITDPKPGDTETVIIISGAPDQTHAAQSLLQAFVLSESESA